jgi:hypothetical protein
MASILYKWFLTAGLSLIISNVSTHPIYVSVIEIEHNAKGKTLEISCKLFTDDLEKVLRTTYKMPVDLINPKDRPAMDRLINDYVQKHFKVSADNRPQSLKYIGFEQEEEGIYCYFEVENVASVKTIGIINNLLYEDKPEQMGLLHITVNGTRKSTKLVNPDDKAVVNF